MVFHVSKLNSSRVSCKICNSFATNPLDRLENESKLCLVKLRPQPAQSGHHRSGKWPRAGPKNSALEGVLHFSDHAFIQSLTKSSPFPKSYTFTQNLGFLLHNYDFSKDLQNRRPFRPKVGAPSCRLPTCYNTRSYSSRLRTSCKR